MSPPCSLWSFRFSGRSCTPGAGKRFIPVATAQQVLVGDLTQTKFHLNFPMDGNATCPCAKRAISEIRMKAAITGTKTKHLGQPELTLELGPESAWHWRGRKTGDRKSYLIQKPTPIELGALPVQAPAKCIKPLPVRTTLPTLHLLENLSHRNTDQSRRSYWASVKLN